MNGALITWRAVRPALTFVALMASVAALAQAPSSSEVKVEASRVTVLPDKHSATGIQSEQIRLSRTVTFGDLDVNSPAGEKALRSRITETATAVCKRIGTLYPGASMEHADQQACIKSAVDTALREANAGASKPLG